MNWKTLGWALTTITLAVAVVTGCNAGPCPSSVNTLTFSLALSDGGTESEDGGCLETCNARMENSLGWTSCAFTQGDAGKEVSCTGPIETCP
ncbi:MAG: hypothetical protein ACLQVI_32610 [Polyangiaceae bacterium]|jgi:hypothetical protein